MKRKHIITLIITILILLIGDIKYFTDYNTSWEQPFSSTNGSRCGIVIDNFTELHNVKHGTRTDYFLKVKYKNYTDIEDVSAKTFYECNKIGSNICLINRSSIDFYPFVSIILTVLILAFGMLILLVLYLTD